ncbi:MAG TPA: DUF3788 family protein [Flavisolibacter sp.]
METIALKEPTVSPSSKVLQTVLGKAFPAYEELIDTITSKDYGMNVEWRYYNDGKAWLCKAQYKKKTVFWLSAGDHYFRTAFYFTEKACPGIFALDIDEAIKREFRDVKHIGKLIPLVTRVTQKKQLRDVLKLVEYKKELK